jgi:alpha-1,6-mannosyltransferase
MCWTVHPRSGAARRRAEQFTWPAAVSGMLAVLDR